MILHANAALSRRQRERLVALVVAGTTITAAALVVGCSRQTASKWVGRARRGEGLADRSSRPHRSPRRTPAVGRASGAARAPRAAPRPAPARLGARARRLDRARDPAPARLLAAEAAPARANRSSATSASGRASCCTSTSRSSAGSSCPATASPVTAATARGGAGWQYVFVAIDDASRLGFAQHLPGRDRRLGARLPRRLRALLRRARRSGRARADRQRHLLQAPLGRRLRSGAGSPYARHGPTGHRRTARSSASSARCSSSGPTPTPTARARARRRA